MRFTKPIPDFLFFGSAGQIDKIVGIQPRLLQSHHSLIRLHFPKLCLLQSGSAQLKPLPPKLPPNNSVSTEQIFLCDLRSE